MEVTKLQAGFSIGQLIVVALTHDDAAHTVKTEKTFQ